jgi:hypothetical protein
MAKHGKARLILEFLKNNQTVTPALEPGSILKKP